ncbi:MAG: hypothetical protein H0W88_12395 [Parachlamydiaceae bacterium]|nr:hypothetical protein [Parachlamydiaceae bacterium]
MKTVETIKNFEIYACLPFVELAENSSIHIGPVIFWPATRYAEFIHSDFHPTFQAYVNSIAQVKAKSDEKRGFVNTVKLDLQGTTCISIEKNVPDQEKEQLIVDSLYLLYFACTFRNLYYNNEIPAFGAFKKMIPASIGFMHYKPNWEHLHIKETDREETVCIHLFDQEICKGFGQMLSVIYSGENLEKDDRIKDYKRLIRAIRYLIDGFFQRFINLFEKGLHFPDIIFEPEDVIFLASSFEALFDINDRQASSDFKQKLRPLLHLKYSRPLELFWKWVDDFFEVRRKIVHGGSTPDPIFRLNPNFEISHILIGIKLFIYSVYYQLYKYDLLNSKSVDPYTPPDFKWIHPEEILLFFWTENNLLRKLSLFLARIIEEKVDHEEFFSDVHLLANLFISMQERYYQGNYQKEIKFIPTHQRDLSGYANQILDLLDIASENKANYERLFDTLPSKFISTLKHRLNE